MEPLPGTQIICLQFLSFQNEKPSGYLSPKKLDPVGLPSWAVLYTHSTSEQIHDCSLVPVVTLQECFLCRACSGGVLSVFKSSLRCVELGAEGSVTG